MATIDVWVNGKAWVTGEWGCFSPLRFGYALFFIIMVYWLIRNRTKFFPPRTRRLKQATEKRKHLVLFLSNLPPVFNKTAGVPEWLPLSEDIHPDIQKIESLKRKDPRRYRWQWEMPLRAIAHHLEKDNSKEDTLQTVTIICSKKSISQIKHFSTICTIYRQLQGKHFYLLAQKSENTSSLIPLSPAIDITPFQGYNFEDFDEIVSAMDRLLLEFAKKGFSERDIMVDITGGQKPTSIVGAAMTFNLKIKAQYVQTNAPWKVISYDVVLSSSDTKGMGI